MRDPVMDGSDARRRGASNKERRHDKCGLEKISSYGRALRNLRLTFGTGGFADPCVSGEPLVHDATQRTVGPAKKYRGRAKGRWFNVSAGGDCLPGLRATDHNHAHEEYSSHD